MQQFRTTTSITFWSDTAEDAQAKIDELKADVADSSVVLSSIEFIAEGPPTVPDPEPVEEPTS